MECILAMTLDLAKDILLPAIGTKAKNLTAPSALNSNDDSVSAVREEPLIWPRTDPHEARS